MTERLGFAALTDIYDAAMTAERWGNALDAIVAAAGATTAALLVRDNDFQPYQVSALSSAYRLADGDIRHYLENLSQLESGEWDALGRQPLLQPLFDDAINLSAAELDDRPDYVFLRNKVGIRRRLGVRFNENKVWFDAMTVGFGTAERLIPAEAVQRLMPLFPHIGKAIEIGRAFAQLRTRYAAVLTALDRVHVGMAVALPSGEIIVANTEADRIFSLADGISLTRERQLLCRNADQTSALRAHLVSAARTTVGEADQSEMRLRVARVSEALPFLVEVAPLRDSSRELDVDLRGAVVTIIDPDRVPRLKIGRFAQLYALTPAEAEVCDLVLQGLRIEEIADTRGTSPLTTKNQVSSILSKAGAARRMELVRTFIRVMPPTE